MIRLPVPPSTNALYRNAPGRGRVKTAAYKAWIEAAGWALKTQHCRIVIGRAEVEIAFPRNNRRDLDNGAKAALDLLVAHRLLQDDRYVERLTLRWHDDAENKGYCFVELMPA